MTTTTPETERPATAEANTPKAPSYEDRVRGWSNEALEEALSDKKSPGTDIRLLKLLGKKTQIAEAIRRRRIEIGDTSETEITLWQNRLTPVGEIEIPPQQDLILGFLHPTGHTILFGQGDTGKGTIAAWLAMRLTANDHNVLIVDFEHNSGEWQPRLTSLGYTPDGTIQYYDPDNRPIWEQAEDIHAAAVAIGATYVIIDSITFACMADVSGGDTQHPANYRTALDTIGLPALSLAHVPKNTKTAPIYPFGSVFWHNAARCTWRIEALETEQQGGTVPSRKVILTCCKRNDGLKPPKQSVEIIYAPGSTGLPISVEATLYAQTQAETFVEILTEHGPALTSSTIADYYNLTLDEGAVKLDSRRVHVAMDRRAKATPRNPTPLFAWDEAAKTWSLA